MANTAPLTAAVEKAKTQLQTMTTVVDGTVVLIGSMKEQAKQAVIDALTADNNADDTSINAATTALDEVFAGFEAQAQKLADLLVVNTPNQPPV